jgi:hypothetical protein
VSGTDESGTLESYCNYNIEGYAATILQDSRFFKSERPLTVEYYPMRATWPDIVKNAEGASQLEGTERFTDLLRGLFVDLSSQDSYLVSRLDVIATDVQKDMDAYINSLLPQLVGKPEMVDDGEGGLVANPTNEQKPYYDEQGNVLPEFVYTSLTPAQIMDAFVLNQTLFANTMQTNPSRVEIGIDLKPGFSGNIGGYEQGDMIRLDVVIAECEPNISGLQSLFSWGGNTNLADAIKNLRNMGIGWKQDKLQMFISVYKYYDDVNQKDAFRFCIDCNRFGDIVEMDNFFNMKELMDVVRCYFEALEKWCGIDLSKELWSNSVNLDRELDSEDKKLFDLIVYRR